MAMHNLPYSGEFIIQVYLEANNLSGRELFSLDASSWDHPTHLL